MTGSSNENCESRSTVARRRWKILAEALQRSSSRDTSPNSASTRKFHTFGLLTFDPLTQDFYSVKSVNSDLRVTVRLLRPDFSPSELTGFNNTGNICIWPSEEILTYYCLSNLHIFSGKSVLELGGGMTCLAGMLVAASGVASNMVLTDGNDLSVSNVEVSLQRNHLPTEACSSLFFDDARESLLWSLLAVLRPGGVALVVAPARSGTFQLFVSMCRPYFSVIVIDKYDDVVDRHVRKSSRNPHYNENLHYPLLMVLSKLGTN